MSKMTFFPIIFLFLLVGTGIKKYEHTYHTGSITPCKSKSNDRAKCQLEYTITNDSLIVGRFQIFDPPSDWSIITQGSFHGILTRVNSQTSFGIHTEGGFEWETICSFDSLDGQIEISKTKGHDHYLGTLGTGFKLTFYLE